ncbi:hypothetical protein P170DRAFT_36578 [Aspergillus steynii IBT 23096]|uniref:Uncharacterized protein n=1 Tax=Aspergillus steynii IBT 23096 TaxID=1392250 RepID=A0A2I2GQU5_9EURO|nr:uncharacterized protein P170DRAFT_36578 [Aspergillus steynii IBT 23096]PLB55262.1 hypothetical protein P170DRAFT_36578 [Aspergillus steynii IBT 23096]
MARPAGWAFRAHSSDDPRKSDRNGRNPKHEVLEKQPGRRRRYGAPRRSNRQGRPSPPYGPWSGIRRGAALQRRECNRAKCFPEVHLANACCPKSASTGGRTRVCHQWGGRTREVASSRHTLGRVIAMVICMVEQSASAQQDWWDCTGPVIEVSARVEIAICDGACIAFALLGWAQKYEIPAW